LAVSAALLFLTAVVPSKWWGYRRAKTNVVLQKSSGFPAGVRGGVSAWAEEVSSLPAHGWSGLSEFPLEKIAVSTRCEERHGS